MYHALLSFLAPYLPFGHATIYDFARDNPKTMVCLLVYLLIVVLLFLWMLWWCVDGIVQDARFFWKYRFFNTRMRVRKWWLSHRMT